jgi:hypothetical protein
LPFNLSKKSVEHNLQVGSDSEFDKSIQDVNGNNQLTDLDDVMVFRKGRKIRHKKKLVKKKKKIFPPKLGIHLIKGKGSLLSPTSIIQNDWSYLELSGVRKRS